MILVAGWRLVVRQDRRRGCLAGRGGGLGKRPVGRGGALRPGGCRPRRSMPTAMAVNTCGRDLAAGALGALAPRRFPPLGTGAQLPLGRLAGEGDGELTLPTASREVMDPVRTGLAPALGGSGRDRRGRGHRDGRAGRGGRRRCPRGRVTSSRSKPMRKPSPWRRRRMGLPATLPRGRSGVRASACPRRDPGAAERRPGVIRGAGFGGQAGCGRPARQGCRRCRRTWWPHA
jgi:hypothetical protein